jgi:hypothetical protein
MSFLSKLFGGGAKVEAGPPKAVAEEEYKGFLIKALPMQIGGEHQLSGTVEKSIAGELKTHRFVRADRLSTREEAAGRAIDKGKQLIDEQGDRLFS